jgi:hypothetical protein
VSAQTSISYLFTDRQQLDSTDPVTSLPQISESQILGYAKYLSEDIGYRTVGTREHALADQWMIDKAEAIKAECDSIALAHGRNLECEVWRQEGSGSHRCVPSASPW